MSFYSEDELRNLGFKRLGLGVRLSRKASIYNAADIEIGDFSRIDDFCVLSAGEGGICVGKHVHVAVFCSLIGNGRIELDDYSGLSSKVCIYSSNDDYSGEHMTMIGGGSAGANLAAVTLLRLRDRHQAARRFARANLVFGVYDLSGTPSQHRHGIGSFRDLYLPEHDLAARRHPDVSPLYADLAGLPPALFTVGTADSLYDDSLFMALRWRAAGNEAELAVYPESVHGFTAFPTAMARAAHARIHRFVGEVLQKFKKGPAGQPTI